MSHRTQSVPPAAVSRPRPRRLGVLALAVACAVPSVLAAANPSAPFVRDGKAGFVVSHIKYALANGDGAEMGACPDGLSLHVEEIFAQSPAGKRQPGESDADYGQRLQQGGRALSVGPQGEDLCMNPEVASPDPHSKVVAGSQVPVFGIDLDGPSGPAAGASCPHGDFAGADGGQGVDNQFYRLVGCTRSYQPDGPSNGFEVEMYSGSWGILVTLEGIDDLRNDDQVAVGIHASADPIMLSPTREALQYATYAMDQDPRFRATTMGRIADGVLTTEPVNVRFHHVVNSIRLERPLRDARLQLTIAEDGTLDGYLAGYTPVEDLYDFQFAFRNGLGGDGQPAPLGLRSGSANGAARVLGHTCPGIYHNAKALADGHPDPQTGACTSLSTQYVVQAIPAFVVDVATASKNEGLKEALRFDDE